LILRLQPALLLLLPQLANHNKAFPHAWAHNKAVHIGGVGPLPPLVLLLLNLPLAEQRHPVVAVRQPKKPKKAGKEKPPLRRNPAVAPRNPQHPNPPAAKNPAGRMGRKGDFWQNRSTAKKDKRSLPEG
jgi:hypothetical protein